MVPHRLTQMLRVARSVLTHGPAPLRLAWSAIRDYGAIQRTWELQSLIAEVRALRPRVVVEIGTHRGGTFAVWGAVAHPAAHLVSIDLPDPSAGLGTSESDLELLLGTLQPAQRMTAIRSDSHAARTLDELQALLGGRPIDFLWIDGDHSADGVRRDLDMYAPLVRRGGIVALHDIHPDPTTTPLNQVAGLWNELKVRYPHREFIDQDHPGGAGMGIGVLPVGETIRSGGPVGRTFPADLPVPPAPQNLTPKWSPGSKRK
jgi:cephalosporin hydroxylase